MGICECSALGFPVEVSPNLLGQFQGGWDPSESGHLLVFGASYRRLPREVLTVAVSIYILYFIYLFIYLLIHIYICTNTVDV